MRVERTTEPHWVVAAGKPLWGTLLALLHKGEPVLGIIDQPYTQERWVGMKGRPTTFNGLHAPIPARSACTDWSSTCML